MLKTSNIKYQLLFLCALFCFGESKAQQSDIKFTSLTTKNGLSSNTVNAIAKDRYGLMWFGTADGLNKFDGTNNTVYRHNVHNSNTIPANNILALHEDRRGRLWVGTGGGGLAYYDRDHDSFVQYKLVKDRNAKNNQGVRAVYDDHNGNIWVSTYDGELRIINRTTNEISKVYIDEGYKYRPNDHIILNFFEDSKKRMWLATNQGLLLYNWKTKKFTHFLHSDSDPKSLSSNIVKMVTEDTKGNIWLATFAGLNLLLPDGKSFRNFKHTSNLYSIDNDNVYAITQGEKDDLWIGTDEGLNIFNTETYLSTRFKPDARNTFSLNNKYVRSIYFDKNGITWIGTLQGGVNKYDKNLPLFNLKISNAYDPNGLAAPVVTSFVEYKQNKVFVGTDAGGLQLFDMKTGLFKRYKIKSKQRRVNSTGELSVLSLEIDDSGKLWIGTLLDGFFRFDLATGNYNQYLSPSAPFEVNQNDIYFIKRISNNDIWIGSNGSGVTVYSPTTNTFKRFKSHPREADDLILPLNGFMRTIAEDNTGQVWLGSWGSGIAVFNPTNQKFSVYNESNSNLPNNEILSILHDSKGVTWVGTNGGGLNYFDKTTKKFVSYSEKDGLANDIIYKILEDKSGTLWLSTNKGISKFNRITKKFENFTTHNGVQSSPFLIGAGLKTATNELFFGGQNGFNYFKPESLPTTVLNPRVLLTDLKISNNVSERETSSPVSDHISVSKEVTLKYGQNFSISYVAVNYTTPQRNRFSYKLIGFDDDWNFVGNAKTAHYTNIYPGDYTFIVRGGDINGTWNKGTAIKIKILPPIWMTIYAYIIYLGIIVGALFYIRHRGIQKLRAKFLIEQEKIQAKQLIDEERREIARQHEVDLQKIKFLTNLSHEFRTPISLILAPIEKLLSQQTNPATANQVNVIKRNAKRLLYLVNQLLDFRKMEENELKINLSPGDLIEFIKEVTESFYDLSERKKIELHFDSIIESLPAKFDHDKIERIIFNLLSNAFKFTHEGGTVRLQVFTLTEKEDQPNPLLYFRVIDTGIGIPKEQQSKIFNNFFQHEGDSSILNQGSGIGLSIVKEFVGLLGGEINLESTVGRGSTFTIKLPVIQLTGDSLNIPNTTPIISQDESNDVITDDVAEIKSTGKTPILLVEDNDDFRFYLKDNLKSSYHIIEASNGKEGWQKALSLHPQLIVTDISMPYLNGIELSRKIKSDKRTSHIPVIMLTATTGEESQITGLQSGANDYLTKPFNFEILNVKIKNLLLLNNIFKDTYSRQITVTGSDIEVESGETKLISAVMNYIEEKLTTPDLSVEDLSKHVGMSRGSLYSKILEITGLTPVEYIRSVKLEKAAALLEKSDFTVAEVAYMTGFGTPSYFSKQFKAKFNMLPSEYVSSNRKHNPS